MSNVEERTGMGWLPDYPDFRDYTEGHEKVNKVMAPTGVLKARVRIPGSVDLRQWCSPIENQLSLGSCTAHAGVGIVEYYEKRAFGKYIDASRLFLYKATRNLLHWTGDTGAFLRTTMGALVLFGVPPEEYWPYKIPDFDKEPAAFCYAFAQNYQTIKYYRHDPPGTSADVLLNRIKTYLSAGHPSMFGFTVYSSIDQADKTGKIPYPCKGERIEGGHAVAAVGYDDKIKITNAGPCRIETKGALLIRNSWGTGWGDAGYGWLPYEYVLKGIAEDFWSALKQEWVDTGRFKVKA
jgi:C1A family cysteine protease